MSEQRCLHLRALFCVGSFCDSCPLKEEKKKYDGYCDDIPFSVLYHMAVQRYYAGNNLIKRNMENLKDTVFSDAVDLIKESRAQYV